MPIAFDLDETRQIFEAAQKDNLDIKAHMGQFEDLRGPTLLADMNGLSADHLEHITDEGIDAMATHNVIAVMLPSACVQLAMEPPPIKKLRNAGVKMAVASDLNPGSAHSSNLSLAMWLACVHYKMTVEEAWLGVTKNAALALRLNTKGTLQINSDADFILWDAQSPHDIPYSFGKNLVSQIFINGSKRL